MIIPYVHLYERLACESRKNQGSSSFADVLSAAMTDDSWKELMRWVSIGTRTRFPQRFITLPCSFIWKGYERKSSAIFEWRSSVELTRETIVGDVLVRSNGNWLVGHLRHFEDQCQDPGKKTRVWLSYDVSLWFSLFPAAIFFITVSLARSVVRCGRAEHVVRYGRVSNLSRLGFEFRL